MPALSYVTMPAADVRPAQGRSPRRDDTLSNGVLTVVARHRQRRRARRSGATASNTPARPRMAFASACRSSSGSRPASARRSSTGSTSNSPDWHKSWHTDWKAIRDAGAGSSRQRRSSLAAAPRSPRPSRCLTATRSRSPIASSRRRRALEIDGSGRQGAAAPSRTRSTCRYRRRSKTPWHCDFETGGAVRRARRRAAPLCEPALHHDAALHPHRRRRARADRRLPGRAPLAGRRLHLRPPPGSRRPRRRASGRRCSPG